MKKVLITMAVLTGMMAGAMVFSSFAAPETNEEAVCSQISANDEWTYIGSYYGYNRDGDKSEYQFCIWEKKNACNAYYWVYAAPSYNPDQAASQGSKNGVLRQNSEKKWYCALNGTNYFIDF